MIRFNCSLISREYSKYKNKTVRHPKTTKMSDIISRVNAFSLVLMAFKELFLSMEDNHKKAN